MNNRLSDLLHELGISKVKLSKFLGVSRQMIYNYLELDDINKWPKDKTVLLLYDAHSDYCFLLRCLNRLPELSVRPLCFRPAGLNPHQR